MKYKIYILIVIIFLAFSVKAEGEATIKNLKVNGTECTCSGYDCTVEVDATSATITYELVDSKAVVDRLSGFKVDLLSQLTTVKIVVTNSENEEKIENTYNIDITKHEKKNDFSLKSLSVNGEKIDIVSGIVVYSYTSEYDAEKIIIDAVANDKNAKVVKEKEYLFDLKEGSLAIDFKVLAENGESETYRVVVTRGVKPNTTLKSLIVEPGNINFDEKIYEYKFTVEYGINEIKVNAIPNNEDAKVDIVNEPLIVGENKITITVTSDKSKSEYVLLVTREENIDKSVANLKELNIEEYPKFDFEENVLDYTLSFSEIPKTLHIKAKAKDPTAEVTILNNENLKKDSKIIVRVNIKENNISRDYTLELSDKPKELHNNKKIVLISIIALSITIIILIILEIHSKKKAKRNYLKKIFELRHKIEHKRKEEKKKKEKPSQKEEELEII